MNAKEFVDTIMEKLGGSPLTMMSKLKKRDVLVVTYESGESLGIDRVEVTDDEIKIVVEPDDSEETQ